MTSNPQQYQFDIFTLAEGERLIGKKGDPSKIDMGGYILRIARARLLTFVKHGYSCQACHRTADHYIAECFIDIPTFQKWYWDPVGELPPIASLNLYGTDIKTSKTFLMTSDHIIPRSLGGSNKLSNRIPLCKECNVKKGNDPDWLTDLPRNRNGVLMHRKHYQTVGKPNIKEKVHA